MQKNDRQSALLSLIGTSEIKSQNVLAAHLAALGFAVTQASVSRDLDAMGVVKVNGHYALPRENVGSGFGEIEIVPVGPNLIVIRCMSGLASAITVKIDAAGIRGIVGTIAGDDTIFVAVAGAADQPFVQTAIENMFT